MTLDLGEAPGDASWCADKKNACGILHSWKNERRGANHRIFRKPDAIKDPCSKPNQAIIFDGASMKNGPVTDGNPISNADGMALPAMDDGAILNIRSPADPDGIRVAPYDGIMPNAGLLSDVHVTNDLRGVGDKNIAVDLRCGQSLQSRHVWSEAGLRKWPDRLFRHSLAARWLTFGAGRRVRGLIVYKLFTDQSRVVFTSIFTFPEVEFPSCLRLKEAGSPPSPREKPLRRWDARLLISANSFAAGGARQADHPAGIDQADRGCGRFLPRPRYRHDVRQTPSLDSMAAPIREELRSKLPLATLS